MDSNNAFRRTGHDQLPQGQELLSIVAKEAKRPVAPGKENQHFVSSGLIIKWLEVLHLPTDFFDKEPSEKLEDAVVMPELLQQSLAQATLSKLNENPSEIAPLLEEITSYLSESDSPQASDVIFVFGSPGMYRIEKAVELYKQKLAPKILISGGRPAYLPEAESEAINYQQYALASGVPADAIILHDDAISIADNVKGGLNKLDELGIAYNSIILVTSWFVERRCYAHMQKYVPASTNLFRVNASSNPSGGLTEDDWYKNEKGLRTVIAELFKLRVAELINTA